MSKNLVRNVFGLSLGFALLSGTALAQALPSSVEPGRIRSQIDQEVKPSSISTPDELTSTPEVQAPAGAEKIFFVLKRVNVSGGHQISDDKIVKAYDGYIGKKISLVQVYEIANKITRMYRDNGYILSRAIVPQQEINNGTVQIQIVEGFVSSYDIQGQIRGGERELNAFAKKLVSSGPLTSKNLERYLLLMNDLPGVKVRSVLAPSKTTVGGAHMTLVVEQDTAQGFVSADNYGNSYLGHERFTVGGQLNSLFESSDQINGTFLWAPDHDELRYYGAGVRHNIGSEGTKIGVNGSYTLTSPSLPNGLGGNLDPEGESFLVGFNVEHPFVRSRGFNVLGDLTFDITKNKNNYGPGLSAIETEDNQRILRAGSQVTYLDGMAGYNTMNAVLSKGLSVFGASDKGDSNLSRTEGDPDFTKFNMEVTRLQRLWGPITGFVGVSGQYSADPLLASEEFGLGGNEYGRGYDSSEITGDHGVGAKVELAYGGSVEKPYLNGYQVYTFYDVGAVWNKDPGAGLDSKDSLASAGVGTRLNFTQAVRGDMFVAKPLTRDIPSRGGSSDDLRFKFSISSNF